MKRPWLMPLVPLYRAGLAMRDRRLQRGSEPVRHLQWPVISIGNLSTGGAGKTPLAITLAELLVARRFHVDVLSRGYGRVSRLPARVGPTGTAEEFGDEPLLIARTARVPVYVAAERYHSGLLAEADAARSESTPRKGAASDGVGYAHILDDGFQHRQLHRDVNILLMNRDDWRDMLLPAGDLREDLQAAMRADVLAIPAHDSEFERELAKWGWKGPLWRLRRRMEVPPVQGTVLAFCGIARPDQFFAGLAGAGLKIAAFKSFRDHYRYTRADAHWILRRAQSVGARALVTTEKDAVRIGELAGIFPADLPMTVARLRVEIEDESEAMASLLGRLRPASPPSAL